MLSRGVLEALLVCPETLALLENKGIPAQVLQTEEYRVGALIHSTC